MANKNRSIVSTVRSKLVAAVAMLLVGVFMVISSSYAWFTLSTAPEVSGIHTSVGANGNLEMALVPSAGMAAIPESAVGQTGMNETWGNLVDLSDNKYGLNAIQLMPSRMTVTGDKFDYLSVPTYGADGRISGLVPAVFGEYVNGSWNAKSDTILNVNGVSAIGTASGMSAQQTAWTQYKRNLSGAVAAAQNKADASFENYGSPLANIVMAKAMQGDDAKFDISFVGDMVAVLKEANADLATAAKWYFAAKAAEALYNVDDATWGAVAAEITALDFATLAADATSVTVAGQVVPFDTTLTNVMAQYNSIKETLTATEEAWTAFEGVAAEATWNETRAVLFDTEFLVYDNILVNGKTTDEIRDMMGDDFSMDNIPQELMDFGLAFGQNGVVDFADGTGVHSAFAKVVGEYQAEISVTMSLGNSSFTNPAVKLRAKANNKIDMYAALTNQPANNDNAEGVTKPINDFYGYMLDLAFRTNAKGSSLMLQTDAVGRIYETNGSEATMGHGSTMTFAVADDDLTMAQVKKLMAAVRIVFMDEEGTIVGLGLLEQDTVNGTYAVSANNEIASSIYLYDYTFTPDGVLVVGDKKEATDGKTALMGLDQNTPTQLTVLVYMDGDKVDNSMVAAETAASLTGTLNLQFSSSADLVPMDYNELKGEAAGE